MYYTYGGKVNFPIEDQVGDKVYYIALLGLVIKKHSVILQADITSSNKAVEL